MFFFKHFLYYSEVISTRYAKQDDTAFIFVLAALNKWLGMVAYSYNLVIWLPA